jgi:hypothetical protein
MRLLALMRTQASFRARACLRQASTGHPHACATYSATRVIAMPWTSGHTPAGSQTRATSRQRRSRWGPLSGGASARVPAGAHVRCTCPSCHTRQQMLCDTHDSGADPQSAEQLAAPQRSHQRQQMQPRRRRRLRVPPGCSCTTQCPGPRRCSRRGGIRATQSACMCAASRCTP